jgi:hypothetical protein
MTTLYRFYPVCPGSSAPGQEIVQATINPAILTLCHAADVQESHRQAQLSILLKTQR